MTRTVQRIFDDAFKLAALARVEAGERPCVVGRDLNVRPKDLCRWRAQVRAHGPAGLHKRGRPAGGGAPPPAPTDPDELAAARARIAELERKIGQQQIDLDFFRGALRRLEVARQPPAASGATPSMAKSAP